MEISTVLGEIEDAMRLIDGRDSELGGIGNPDRLLQAYRKLISAHDRLQRETKERKG